MGVNRKRECSGVNHPTSWFRYHDFLIQESFQFSLLFDQRPLQSLKQSLNFGLLRLVGELISIVLAAHATWAQATLTGAKYFENWIGRID